MPIQNGRPNAGGVGKQKGLRDAAPKSMQPHTPSATLGSRSSALLLILTNAKVRIIFGFRVTLFYFFCLSVLFGRRLLNAIYTLSK